MTEQEKLHDLAEQFSVEDMELLQAALTEMTAGSLTYAHPVITLCKLRTAFNPTYIPPLYRLAPPDRLVGVTQTLLEQLRGETAVSLQLSATDVIEAVQQLIKASGQQQAADLKALNSDNTLWYLQTSFYRLVYHQNETDKKLTLLALTTNLQSLILISQIS